MCQATALQHLPGFSCAAVHGGLPPLLLLHMYANFIHGTASQRAAWAGLPVVFYYSSDSRVLRLQQQQM